MAPSPMRVPTPREAGVVALFGSLLVLLLTRKQPQAIPPALETAMVFIAGTGGGLLMAYGVK